MAMSGTQQWQCLSCKEVFPNWEALPIHVCVGGESTQATDTPAQHGNKDEGNKASVFVLPKPEFSTQPDVAADVTADDVTDEPEEEPMHTSDEKGHVSWSHSAILELLDVYQDHQPLFNGGLLRKNEVWRRVGEVMKERGYNFTGELCDIKMRAMKQRMRAILKANAVKGRHVSKWPYFSIMDQLFGHDPSFVKLCHSAADTGTQQTSPSASVLRQPIVIPAIPGSDPCPDLDPASPSSPNTSTKTHNNQSNCKEARGTKRVRKDEELEILEFIQQQSNRMDEVIKVASQRNATLQKLMTQILIQQQQFLQSQQDLQRQQQQMILQLQQQQLSLMQLMQQQWQQQFNRHTQMTRDRDTADVS